MAGFKAFREAYVSAGEEFHKDWSDWEGRKLRYSLLWSMYESSSYRDLHSWARKYRADYGLYKHTRDIYNPAYRLIEFWVAHLWGGVLPKQEKTAMPLVTENEAVRLAVRKLWSDSNWQIKKDLFTLFGALFGDVALEIVDDREREKVYLEVVHPAALKEISLDPFGNVKAYTREEKRPDPQGTKREVIYTEMAKREGDLVNYQTLLDGSLYAWNGKAEWSESYGFIPFFFLQHRDIGKGWGWSELQPSLSKIREVDDLASKLSDQIRKSVDSPWLLSGVKSPQEKIKTGQEKRDDVPVFYAPSGASATPLVAPLDIMSALEHIKSILDDLERNYPELRYDRIRVGGDVSGRALRLARQPAESKVQAKRAIYDDLLVRAQMGALAIGGWRGYEGYKGFDLDSYAKGELSHDIGNRPVFAIDPLEEIEQDDLFWGAAQKAVAAGVPLVTWLADKGWSEERIMTITSSPEYQARLNLLSMGMGQSES